MMARRLTRRGLTLSASGLVVSLLATHARGSTSYPLVSVTVQGVIASALGSAAAGNGLSEDIVHLTKGATSMTKKTIVAAFGVAVFLTVVYGLGSAVAERNGPGSTPPPRAETSHKVGGNGGATEPDHITPIVNKAIQALSDPKLQGKHKGITLDMHFEITANGIAMKFQAGWSALGHDKYRAELTITDNQGKQQSGLLVVNGKNGWSIKEQKLEQAEQYELVPVLVMLHAVRFCQKPGQLLGKECKLSPLGELQIQDKTAVGLKIEQEGVRDIHMYFDKKTGLPLQSEFSVPKQPKSPIDTKIVFAFSDYKQVAGIKHFTKLTVYQEQKELATVELSNIRLHETLQADLFAKPANPAGQE